MKFSSLFFLSLLVSPIAFAEESAMQPSIVEQANYSDNTDPKGYWIFGGVDSALINSDVHDGLVNGTTSSARVSLSQYQTDRIIHVGAGLGFVKYPGLNRRGSLATDFAYRIRYDRQWSYGPEAQLFLGSGDLWNSSTGFLTPFIGAGVAREISFRDNIVRVGARAMMDLTVKDATNFLGQLYFEMGFGWEENRSTAMARLDRGVYQAKLTAAEQKILALEQENQEFKRLAAQPAPKALDAIATTSSAPEKFPINTEVTYDLPAIKAIMFELSKNKLTKAEEKKVASLAKQLNAEKSKFRVLEIIGHADRTGSEEKNKKLSMLRAKTVAQTLKKYGWHGKTEIVGLGSSFPAEDGKIESNRRVDIRIEGAKDDFTVNSESSGHK